VGVRTRQKRKEEENMGQKRERKRKNYGSWIIAGEGEKMEGRKKGINTERRKEQRK
jgi:hypothetical protein